jgi:mono/diheme cytochrome c family protein
MKCRLLRYLTALCGVLSLTWAQASPPPDTSAVERGAVAVRKALSPADFSLAAYEMSWKQWGLKEKPADFDKAVLRRYGLHEAPYDNQGLPMGLAPRQGLLGKGISGTCLLCHAGSVAGQTIIGLGNSSLDFQGLLEEMRVPAPITFSRVRGTIEATAVVTLLMEFRDADLNLRVPGKLNIKNDLCEDVPAWWNVRKKKTMYHTGTGHARSVRTMMPFLLNPLNSAETIKKQEPTFADIQAYILTLEPPQYPFPIDQSLAARGHALFTRTCAKCHGTYGPDATYPSKVVPLDVIGTDRRLAEGTTPEAAEHYLKSWFAQEKRPDGKPYPKQTVRGYQAPPLDGVWATAPYLHNGSVPTLDAVLNSKTRPKIFTRSYRTEKEDYDSAKGGWKITVLEQAPDPKMPALGRRKIYDTTQPGRDNGGHTFGDDFTDAERRAVIEYLKTL